MNIEFDDRVVRVQRIKTAKTFILAILASRLLDARLHVVIAFARNHFVFCKTSILSSSLASSVSSPAPASPLPTEFNYKLTEEQAAASSRRVATSAQSGAVLMVPSSWYRPHPLLYYFEHTRIRTIKISSLSFVS